MSRIMSSSAVEFSYSTNCCMQNGTEQASLMDWLETAHGSNSGHDPGQETYPIFTLVAQQQVSAARDKLPDKTAKTIRNTLPDASLDDFRIPLHVLLPIRAPNPNHLTPFPQPALIPGDSKRTTIP